jgi:hypothetical protein
MCRRPVQTREAAAHVSVASVKCFDSQNTATFRLSLLKSPIVLPQH